MLSDLLKDTGSEFNTLSALYCIVLGLLLKCLRNITAVEARGKRVSLFDLKNLIEASYATNESTIKLLRGTSDE